MAKETMTAVVAMAAGVSEEKNEKVEINAAFIKQHFSAVAAELIGEGAKAEQTRIAGIEAFAGLGHDKIIAAHKADPSKTALDAGLAVAGAQRAVLSKAVDNLDADEKQVKNLRSETANDTATATAKVPGAGLEGEPKWKAEWDASADLQAEFKTQAQYIALKRAEGNGIVKRLKNRAA